MTPKVSEEHAAASKCRFAASFLQNWTMDEILQCQKRFESSCLVLIISILIPKFQKKTRETPSESSVRSKNKRRANPLLYSSSHSTSFDRSVQRTSYPLHPCGEFRVLRYLKWPLFGIAFGGSFWMILF